MPIEVKVYKPGDPEFDEVAATVSPLLPVGSKKPKTYISADYSKCRGYRWEHQVKNE